MKLFEFSGPAIMILIITSFVSHQIGNNNPGGRDIAMQEFSSYTNCAQAAEFILQTQPGSIDTNGLLTGQPGAQNTHRQIIDVGCVPK